GGQIFISPRARCSYYVREAPSRLFKQYLHYGYWRVAVLRKHRRPATIRQIVPIAFFSLIPIALVVGLHLPGWWRVVGAGFPSVYVLALITSGVWIAIKKNTLVGFMFPVATTVIHLAYAVGFVWGVIAGKIQKMP